MSGDGDAGRTWIQALDAVAKLGAVAGALVAVWQYWSSQSAQRVSRTLEYVQRYEAGDVGQARGRINAVLLENMPRLQDAQERGISASERDTLVRGIIDTSPGMEADVENVLDFFEGLYLCVDGRLCDERSSKRYFARDGGDAAVFWSNFEPYIRYRRENNPTYGEGLAHTLCGESYCP